MNMDKRPHSFVVIDQAAPVTHLHHGGKAEDGLLVQAAGGRHSEGPGGQLYWLVLLCPSKLLLPYLQMFTQDTKTLVKVANCQNLDIHQTKMHIH